MIKMVFQLLFGIPGIAYILALAIGTIVVAASAVVLGWVQITVMKIVFFGAGIYILLKFLLPQVVEKGLNNRSVLFLAALTMIFILLGIPGIGLNAISGI
ncbi:MAG: hypothetical protein V3U02_06615 [Calditrichia bacterium]